ncbi:MAG TPA: hypothetical protein VMZ50_13660 [Phycisphaerae bacterium]|nr:hypothetical protein [Phycisphaerae bacterium]
MSLQQWVDNAWARTIEPSRQAVADLLTIADREIADASVDAISVDGRFDHAYSAVRSLCEAALHASGYTIPKGGRQHERVIESLKFTLGGHWGREVDFLDRCRRLRHQTLYERSGVAQAGDANQLLDIARKLNAEVRQWLGDHHPDLA